MIYIKSIYNIKEVEMKKLLSVGFKRFNDDSLVYKFVIYKYNNKPLVYGTFTIFDDERTSLHINTADIYGNFCNFNKEEFGISTVVEENNKKIYTELIKLKKKGILKL